jgi:serine/threonine protein kinase
VGHDGECPVSEFGEVQGHPFVVMQYVSGGSLREVGDDKGDKGRQRDKGDTLHL